MNYGLKSVLQKWPFKSGLQNKWVLFFLLSSLWAASVVGPLLYAVISPNDDIQAIILSLQGRGTPPSQAVDIVQDAMNQGGRLGRTIHVAHYAGVSIILRDGESHTKSKTEDSYLAWFQKAPESVLLTIRQSKVDGAVQSYEMGSDAAPGFLARAYGPPLFALIISLCLFLKPSHAKC
jgi:hypothetical protein